MYTKEQQLKKKNKPRKKKCKTCKDWFIPERPMQTTCGVLCAIKYSNKDEVKTKAINKQKKEIKMSDKPYLMKIAQTEVNRYVRLRDKNKPCISCYTPNAKWDAGHFKSAGGHQQLRFNTLNIHKQCMRCNQYLSGNLVEYEKELVKKIGKDRVEAFKTNHEIAKYDVEYLQRLIKVFRAKIKLYEKKFRTCIK